MSHRGKLLLPVYQWARLHPSISEGRLIIDNVYTKIVRRD